MLLPDNPEEPVLPIVNGANAPYWVVGHSDWDMRTIHMDDNACLTCHRANTGMIGLGLGRLGPKLGDATG